MQKNALRVVLLLLMGAGIAWYLTHDMGTQPSSKTLVFYGNIDLRQVDLAFNDAGRITHIAVQAGDRVHEGQPIATLDSRRFDAAVLAAEAQLAASEAIYAKLIHGSRPEEIERLRALVAADEANLSLKQRTEQRLNTLAQQKLASPQDRDVAQTARSAAAAQLKADQATLQLAVIGSRKEDIDAAKSAVDAAKAALRTAQIARHDADLTAPANGVVRNRLLEPGDMASPAQPVISLALSDPRWARIYLDETQLGLVHEGMPASLSSDSFPGKTFSGWVGFISPTAEFTPKTVESPSVRTSLVYQARVYVCSPSDDLRLGMPVTVHIDRDAKAINHWAAPCPSQRTP